MTFKIAVTSLLRITRTATVRNMSSSVSCEEVRIPVPWGHIAGKWWGRTDKRPVVAIHGWQDNSGTFDLLIPKLPQHLGYLAIDLPGHGHSSWLPPGMFYHGIDGVFALRTIQRYFNWDKMTFLGHSLGAIMSYTFGIVYPSNIDLMICLDALQPLITPGGAQKITKVMEDFIKFDEQSRSVAEPPSYTLDEIAQRLHAGTRKSIDLDKCEYIYRRNIYESKKNPGRYFFSRDPRLKCGSLLMFSPEVLLEAAKNVTYPLLFTLAEKSPFFSQAEYYKKTLEVIRSVNPDFEMHRMKGRHHAHLNTPDEFVGIITEFIGKHDKADRSNGGMVDAIQCKL